MYIYLTRHGQTEWNLIDKIQGYQDSNLTRKGVEDAQKLGEKLRNIDFDLVYSSDQGRAIKSAEIITNKKKKITSLYQLREIGVGKWEGMKYSEIINNYPEEFMLYKTNPEKYVPTEGGEDYFVFERRIKNFLNELIKQNAENVLIVTHGLTYMMLMTMFQNKELNFVVERKLPKGTALSKIKYANNKFEIIFEDNIDHLKEEKKMELKSVKRSQVEEKYTWDLSAMAKDEAEFKKGLNDLEKSIIAFEKNYKGKIKSVEDISKMLVDYEDILQRLHRFSGFATLENSVEQGNPTYQEHASLAGNVGELFSEKMAFVESELIQLDEEILKEAEKVHQNKGMIHDVLMAKKHYLGADVEQALSSLERVFGSPYSIYVQAKHADLRFENFEVEGKTYPNSFVLYENYYEGLGDTPVRRKAFEAFSKDLRKYQNTMAATLAAQVQKEKALSKLRGFDSVIDYLLYSQEVTREMYNRQIDTLMEKFAPVVRKFVGLIKRVNKLDKLTYADLKIALDPDFNETITIEEAKEKLMAGLKILGDDYVEMIRKAFDERWIDFAINDGKSNGAFCLSPYGVHPYILNSWTGSLEDLFVLGHELGHAGHFTLAGKEQNITNTRPSLYFIESPSTTNELIIANDMLNWSEEPTFKRFVYASMISRTYYHNMVTHLLEAHFQREVYNRVDRGEGINATVLNKLFMQTLEKFWQDTVELTDGAELTWMRQLHYYRGLYPYTYSAGLTIGTEVSKRIVKEGKPAVEAWRKTLKSGGTQDPIGLAKIAGVDITTDKPLNDTIKFLSDIVDNIEKITDEIEGK